MSMKQKLELTWVGKNDELKIEPRILIEDKSKSNVEKDPNTENMLIHGDNLLALKALEQQYAGKIKCIYIDPPYNTGSAFEYYDDSVEHSTWLSLMKPRLELLRNLMRNDGCIFIQLDDNEVHYCKVLCDEIFGRNNFITTIVWHKKRGKDNSSRYFSITHDFILVYAKDATKFYINRIDLDEITKKAYSNPDNDPRGVYRVLGLWSRQQGGSEYEYTTKGGKKFSKRLWLVNLESMKKLEEDNRLIIKGDNLYRKFFLTENKGSIPETIWIGLSNNANAKDELKKLFGKDNLFDTPKPEPLMERIFSVATQTGDLILDSFLGSGTTAAVAHKMKRNYIGIEMGDHAYTHCKVRLDKVIDGSDNGGITESQKWQGGGGYRFYELAPTLIKEDAFGQAIINPEYNAEMLAAAVAKHEGYYYEPNKDVFWKQSNNHGKSFLYVTTNHITNDMIEKIKDEMQDDEFLLIACKSFDQNCKGDKKIAIKKIPQSLLKDCEYGKDDYKLNIVCPPEYEDGEDE